MNRTSYLLFVSCAPGLEGLLVQELEELGLQAETKEGGVELRAPLEGLWRIALASAVAEGLRVRLRSFVARDFGALIAGLERLPWRAYLRESQAVRVRVTCHRSKLWHSGAVEERVLAVLGERAGATPAAAASDEDEPHEPNTIFVRITGDAVQVSVDAGGRLHRRGYRTHVEKASLRETLAAALIRVAEAAQPGAVPSALWDPFCGAGTVICEAARRWGGTLPGGQRTFPFENWRTHEAAPFHEFRSALAAEARVVRTALATPIGAHPLPVDCIGSDISERAVAAATHNAELGGVAPSTRFVLGDFHDIAAQIPRGAWLVTNPPYGERLEGAGLMTQLGQLLGKRRDLRPVVLLVGGAAKKELAGHYKNELTTKNGGLDVSVRILAH